MLIVPFVGNTQHSLRRPFTFQSVISIKTKIRQVTMKLYTGLYICHLGNSLMLALVIIINT